MLKSKIKVSVLGATGIVGQNYLSLLDNHPWFSVVDVAASKNNSGKIFSNAVNGKWALKNNIPASVQDLVVRDVFDFESIPADVRCVFSAVDLPSKEDTKKLEFDYAKKGFALISNNSANRLTNDVPMIIPEINSHHTDVIPIQQENRSLPKGGFVAVKPNCSIQSYIVVIDALIKAGHIPKEISVTTLQALSGAGKAGLENENLRENVVPYISGEEEKTENEPLKIFGTVSKVGITSSKDFNISAVCTRVPVIDGHTAVVYLNFLNDSLNVENFKSLLSSYNNHQLLDLPSSPKKIIRVLDGVDRPQPKLDCEKGNGMETIVGRIEKDKIFDMRFIGLSHNTVRGAAGGAILMAELLVKKSIYMINKSIRVNATASVANVSCGFDCLGFSIKGPSDVIRIEEKKTAGIEIIVTGKKCNDIPLDPKKNTAGKALLSFLNEVSEEPKYKIHIEKGIPPGSGLGSSAASAVSSVFGINALLDYPLNDHELLIHAMEGESAASGSLHADNVAPVLFGGIVLIRSYDPLDTISLPVPENLFCTAVLPDVAVNTFEARKILPENITLGSAVEQSSNLAGFIAGLYEEDYELIGKSMIDLFAEPHRSKLIPHYMKLKNSAFESGAIGCGISGSGPSIFALSKSEEIAKNIGENFCNSYNKYGINSISYHSKINLDPPKILD